MSINHSKSTLGTVWSRGALSLLLAGAPLGALAGCTAEVHTAQPEVVTDDEVVVDTAPAVDVTTYPHTEYRGQAVYYVNGRWYRPHGKRWVYYRNEPPELVRHRRNVEQAPPARRAYEPRPGEATRVR